MKVLHSTATERSRRRSRSFSFSVSRGKELIGLVLGSVVIVLGLWLVLQAKLVRPTPFESVDGLIASRQLLNLNTIDRREALLPFLTSYENAYDKQFVAQKIYDFVKLGESAPVPNVGALARLRATEQEIDANRRLVSFRQDLDRLRSRPNNTGQALSVPVISQISDIKPFLIVRTPAEFRYTFFLWAGLYLLAFYVVHVVWRMRGFAGDQLLLPIIQVLTGIGLILMVSIRDPLRDTLTFVAFAQAVVIGCLLILISSQLDFERLFGKLSFVPLGAALVLSALLIVFGHGPGTSDAKVNLWGFQPVEIIKILVILFLAGYFGRRWELLRELKEKPTYFSNVLGKLNIPRLDYLLPVLAGMGLVLVFFFLQKDLGPALVLSCLFLTLYGIARGKLIGLLAGFLLMAAGFYVNYHFVISRTVAERVQIWLTPWDNGIRGGEQLAHSFWALASGGFTGTGLGLGDPTLVPAIHTDLIISAVGEELGFIGLIVVLILYALLIARGLRAALDASNSYACFLSIGLSLLVALQVLLISLGILGLIPLSGVVSPFLSYGRTAILTNFVLFGIVLSITNQRSGKSLGDFRKPVKYLAVTLGVLAVLVLAKAAYFQIVRNDETIVASALTPEADGVRRFHYNPRILQVARTIPKGTIFDRNGIPLATSNWDELDQHRKDYERLMSSKLEDLCPRSESRCYPFGAQIFHLLGDARTRFNWAATNTAYIERDSLVRLQGYDDHSRRVESRDPRTGETTVAVQRDFRELIPLLHHRYEPDHESVLRILQREKSVRTSIDIRLQLRVSSILQDRIRETARQFQEVSKGAIVVLEPSSGDLLASVSYPLPDTRLSGASSAREGSDAEEAFLDRARFGLYPPGSTFKLVTAIAGLRKSNDLLSKTYDCVSLGNGRVGNFLRGWGSPIRDDVQDRSPHGAVSLDRGLTVSCNAFFAQFGTFSVGAEALFRTAELMGISVARPNTVEQLRREMPQASYGQGQVVASPFQMARVAATIANHGRMPFGRWVTDESNQRVAEPREMLTAAQAEWLSRAMRHVVTSGTATRLRSVLPEIAGKTGTAELENQPSHSWFAGFAPANDSRGKRIAFAVIIENGGYGGRAAVPAAGELVEAARELDLLR
jgi:cell division protein FtsW (lipid II flippase)